MGSDGWSCGPLESPKDRTCAAEKMKVSGCYQRKNAAGRDCGCENVSRISMETWQMANSRKFKSQSFSHSTSKRHNTG